MVNVFAYSHNLVRVYMKCDYTCLNLNSSLSKIKIKMITKGMIIKGFIAVCNKTSSHRVHVGISIVSGKVRLDAINVASLLIPCN